MPISEIATFNFPSANEEGLHKMLGEVRWKEVLSVNSENPVRTLKERFID